MKKYFKSPDELKRESPKALVKALKATFDKLGTAAAKFFYKAEMEYINGEKAPFLYIGSPAGAWKMFIKNAKKDADFAAGICKLETNADGSLKLLLCVEAGKGGKPIFLKVLNKVILRKTDAEAEFVEEIAAPLAEEEEGEESEEAADDVATAADSPKVDPKAHIELLKKIIEEFKGFQEEFDDEKLDRLTEVLDEWQDDFASIDPVTQAKMASVAEQAKKIKQHLQKVAILDARLEEQLADTAVYLQEWDEMEDSDSPEAQLMEKLIMKKLDDIEKAATPIKDKKILAYCAELRTLVD